MPRTNTHSHARRAIKKWKLLKAAVKSFWQTIAFSFRPRIASGELIGLLAIGLFFAVTLAAIDYVSFPWNDEVGTADTAVNCVLRGRWFSHVWPYSYNPLHINLLIGWLWLFGVSHFTVVSFGVVCALLLCLVLRQILIRAGILQNVWLHLLYAVLFWFGGWTFSEMIVNGRIDMLSAFLTVLFVRELWPATARFHSRWAVLSLAFLMMMASVYQIPVVACFGLLLLLTRKTKDERMEVFKKGVAAAVGIFLAFTVSCLYYGCHHHLVRFVHAYFSYNGTLSAAQMSFAERVARGYCHDIQISWLLVAAVFFAILKYRHVSVRWILVLFLALIPFIAVVGGRYELYYGWQYYLPVIAFLLYVFSRFQSRALVVLVILVLLGNGVWRVTDRWSDWTTMKRRLADAQACVAAHSDVFRVDNPVVMNAEKGGWLFYYSLVNSGAIAWRGDGIRRNDITPQEKFAKFLKKNVRDPELRARCEKIFNLVEHNPETLPRPYYSCMINEKGEPVVDLCTP